MRLIVVGDCVSLKHTTRQTSTNTGKSSCTDQKGIKRGRCQDESCGDCDSYLHDPLRGAQCQYCGCFPTKHRRLDDSLGSFLDSGHENPEVFHSNRAPEIQIIDNGTDMTVYDLDDDGNIVLPEQGSANGEDRAVHNTHNTKQSLSQYNQTRRTNVTFDNLPLHTSRENLYGFCVPSHLPIKSLKTGTSMPIPDQQFIIKWISWAMWNMQVITLKDFLEVSKLALRRYPELEFAFAEENGVTGLAKALRAQLGDQWILHGGKLPHHTASLQSSQSKITSKSIQNPVPRSMQNPASKSVPALNPIQNSAPKSINNLPKSNENQLPKEIVLATPPAPVNDVVSAKQHELRAPAASKHYENFKIHIAKEMAKATPSLPILRTFLLSCRKERTMLARMKPISAQLEDFPCFENSELLMWEFIQQEQLQCSYEDLKKRWLSALPQMIVYFASGIERLSSTDVITEGQATVEILQCLTSPKFFGTSKSGDKERSSCVLELFEGNVLPLFIFPQKGDPPRLFAIGSADDQNLVTYIYVDGKVFFKGDVVDALIHLVACYFVFGASPSADAQAAFSFVYGILMKEKAEEKYKRFRSVVLALESVW